MSILIALLMILVFAIGVIGLVSGMYWVAIISFMGLFGNLLIFLFILSNVSRNE